MSDKATSLQTVDRPAGQTSLRIVDPETLYGRMNELYDEISRRLFNCSKTGAAASAATWMTGSGPKRNCSIPRT